MALRAMDCFHFQQKFINWVEQCIATVSFSILLNGTPFSFFQLQGLRQGIPLSHFLFILGSEILFPMLLRTESNRLIHGHKTKQGSSYQ